ncbi:hypothetical protein J5N97_002702 [Dioscorea zingiberensis]|uniref:Uncharacterized protein n=1 Tax=Dioscorea zingiberensis TaxID=325984 RepID=A0A9D5HPV7_9LILI|nr:hypothetical protein J5N97_002702 [Dioscorea zingiberensis]
MYFGFLHGGKWRPFFLRLRRAASKMTTTIWFSPAEPHVTDDLGDFSSIGVVVEACFAQKQGNRKETKVMELENPSNGGEIKGSSNGYEIDSSCSADEIFLNGQIRPMRLASHLQRPQTLTPLIDADEDDDDDDHRRDGEEPDARGRDLRLWSRSLEIEAITTSSALASSLTSFSSGRNSKRWIFLKDLLYRSKSEGRGKEKEKFWHSISFSPSKEKDKSKPPAPSPPALVSEKPRPNKSGPKRSATATSTDSRRR